MKTLVLFSVSLAVALGLPRFEHGVAQKLVLPQEDRSPLGDWVPVQGNVEPEMREEHFLDQPVMLDTAMMEEEPVVEGMGDQSPPLEDNFLSEDPIMGLEPGIQQDSYSPVMAEPGKELLREEELASVVDMPPFQEPVMGEDDNVVNEMENVALQEGVDIPTEQDNTASRRNYCTGVVLDGKCYQFFRGPKKAPDAEAFCQSNFRNGHLASITCQHIHRQVMAMMLQQNGAYTRTWVGGVRNMAEPNRFTWLDGADWCYADWLQGEPNNTSDVENCVELLAIGDGKFNDMPCWDLRAFVCSYPYQ